MAGLQFDQFGFYQTRKYVVIFYIVNWLNPNQLKWRPVVHLIKDATIII